MSPYNLWSAIGLVAGLATLIMTASGGRLLGCNLQFALVHGVLVAAVLCGLSSIGGGVHGFLSTKLNGWANLGAAMTLLIGAFGLGMFALFAYVGFGQMTC